MAKARARSAARKVKDRWRAKEWYQILAPTMFNQIPVSETLAEKPELIIDRTSEVSMQEISNDFRKSHVKLYFRVDHVEENKAFTTFKGHELTSDYVRRLVRRRKSRIDGVYDVVTKDGARVRVKPFAITDKRIQTSQKKIIREKMKETIIKDAAEKTMNEFIRACLEGKISVHVYKACKEFYPVKRVEINKSEVIGLPTVEMEDSFEEKEEKVKAETPEEKEESTPEDSEPVEESKEPTKDAESEVEAASTEESEEEVSAEESSEEVVEEKEPEKKEAPAAEEDTAESEEPSEEVSEDEVSEEDVEEEKKE